MSDNIKDPKKPGSQPGSQAGKRPTATLDLQATEIERRDIPGAEPDKPATDAKLGAKADAMKEEPAKAAPQKPDEGITAKPAKPAASAAKTTARTGSGAGNFVSHLLAGFAGAGLAIFGADYLANTIGLALPTYSAAQVDQLSRRMATLEQSGKENNGDATTSLMREQLDALKVKVEQTAATTSTLGTLQADQKQLADRAAKLEQGLNAVAPSVQTDQRVGKLEDQFKMLAQAGAAGQAGNAGIMASLIAKVDGIGANLDTHLDEMRRGLQSDLQKQSTHFETRLSEVDKSMSVDTLKASSKALSDQIVGLRADGDKLRQDIATVTAGNENLRKDLAALQQSSSDLKTKIETDAATFAKSQQLTDANATTAKLQADVAAITARDQSREQGANRILLSLQLASLKRAVDSGGPYAKELAEVKRGAPKSLDLSALDAGAEKGLPTTVMLTSQFKDLTWSILNADAKPSGDGSLLGELWKGATSVVQVRRTGEVSGDGTDAIVARTEAKLQAGDLDAAQKSVSQLAGGPRKAAEQWMANLAGRLAVDQAMTEVEGGLAKMMTPTATN